MLAPKRLKRPHERVSLTESLAIYEVYYACCRAVILVVCPRACCDCR